MELRSLWFLDLEADFLELDWGMSSFFRASLTDFDIFHGFGVVGDGIDCGLHLFENLRAHLRPPR